MGKMIAVCSGSGGVGKTTVALSLAIGLAHAGQRTVLLDMSAGARCCDLLLGMESVVTIDLSDVISGQAMLETALYPVPSYANLTFVCASLYDGSLPDSFSGAVLALQTMFDYLVLDMPTGCAAIGHGVFGTEDEMLVVLTPDDASIRSAERLINGISRDKSVSLVINKASRDMLRHKRQYSPETLEMILDKPVLAQIPDERAIVIASLEHKPAAEIGAAKGPMNRLVRSMMER